MGKFGKKNEVSLNPLDYNICLLGESKIGKSTLIKEVCEKLVTPDGYIHFDIGREEGASAIEGIVSETIENWAKLDEVIDDIVDNKASDYPDLKVVVWDTLDELILLAEAESVRLYNRSKAVLTDSSKRADTINAAWGGFGKGQQKASDLILDAMWRLKGVGVSSIIIGHVKRTDIIDPVTQSTYSKLTADTTQSYFNIIKNKMHFIGLAYIDREVVKEKTGRRNVVTGQDITTNKVVSESRVISFRDDTYSVDSGSRFANIEERIPFDSDSFIKAMQDAIIAEKSKSGKSLEEAKVEQAAREAEAKQIANENSAKIKKEKEEEVDVSELVSECANLYKSASSDLKKAMRSQLQEYGYAKLSDTRITAEQIKTLIEILKEE